MLILTSFSFPEFSNVRTWVDELISNFKANKKMSSPSAVFSTANLSTSSDPDRARFQSTSNWPNFKTSVCPKNGQKKRLFVHPKNHRNFPNLMMQVLSLPLGLIKTIIHADFDDASRVNATDASQQRLVL